MKKYYATYEQTEDREYNGTDIRTEKDWFLYYLLYVDNTEYPDFVSWISDMLRSGVFVDVTEDIFVYGRNHRTGAESIIEAFQTVEQAESFCESWGWMYDDGKDSYTLSF